MPLKHETPDHTEHSQAAVAETVCSDEAPVYRKPLLVPVAGAIGIIQGATGKHYDGSTGYFWDNEG